MIGISRLSAFAIVAALGVPRAAACQQGAPASSAIGVMFGVADFHQHDDNLSPITFRGALPSAGAMFERRSGRTLVSLEGGYDVGHTNSTVLPRDVQQHVAHVSITVERALSAPRSDGRGLSFYAGGGLSTLGSVTDLDARDAAMNYSYRDWSYYWAHNLDLAARAELSGSRRSAGLQVRASVVRLASRPNNGKDFNAENARVSESWPRSVLRGRPEYAWDHPVVFAQGDVRQRLAHRLQLRVAYDFTFASSARPQPIGVYVNRFQVGLLRPM